MWNPQSTRPPRRGLPPAASELALILAVSVLPGCDIETFPTAPRSEDPGHMVEIESAGDLATESACFTDPAFGADHFAVIAAGRRAASRDVPLGLYCAAFQAEGCGERSCAPSLQQLLAPATLSISGLDWSPAGALVTFQGKSDGEQDTWIYVHEFGRGLRKWLVGSDPAFSSDGACVLYVDRERGEVRSFDPVHGGGGSEWRGLNGAAHPRLSPDGRWIACSAVDISGISRQIWVRERGAAVRLDPVSLPEGFPGRDPDDGAEDDFPVWSPGGTYIAYRARERTDGGREAILVTRPAAEPENPVRVGLLEKGQRLTSLAWHRSGRVLLVVAEGDVYALAVPERFWEWR